MGTAPFPLVPELPSPHFCGNPFTLLSSFWLPSTSRGLEKGHHLGYKYQPGGALEGPRPGFQCLAGGLGSPGCGYLYTVIHHIFLGCAHLPLNEWKQAEWEEVSNHITGIHKVPGTVLGSRNLGGVSEPGSAFSRNSLSREKDRLNKYQWF